MAEAKITKKVIVPAVAEVVEERVTLELTRDEAERIYDISGALAGSADHGLPGVYNALQVVFGGFGSGKYRLVVENDITPRLEKRV